jgi:hypothetical protein
MRSVVRSVALVGLFALVGACSGAPASGSPPGSVPPSGGPASTPGPSTGDSAKIDHATGATDIVLRYDEGGGFMGPGYLATSAPIFTLYGDGTVIFRDPRQAPLPPVGDVRPQRPFRTARLSEEQIQSTLVFAIGEGGLGTARLEYGNDQIADASTATFTLNAGGLTKTVSVYALGLDVPGMKDVPQRAAFARLADRLRTFDGNGAILTQEFAPERYRGILFGDQPADPGAKPWPWADVKPSDFVVAAGPGGGQPTHVLTVAQAEALGIEPYRGGVQGLTLAGPERKFYAFLLRPLLPDEEASNES